jgi:hypothetical protein
VKLLIHHVANHNRLYLVLVISLILFVLIGISALTAQGEDVQQAAYPLPVEYVGKMPGYDWLTQIVVKLPADINGNDKLWVSINLHGAISNKVPVRIKTH